jgi:mono/diheme cytochrome c family protein
MGATVLAPSFRFTIALGLTLMACQRAPDDLRQWRAADHRNSENSGAAKKGQVSAQPASANVMGVDQVVLSTWQNNCASCHGRTGAGDGPQAALYQPRDLSDPEFQKAVSDEQLFTSIQKGKGKMPGFALPDGTARGLVRLVRLIGGAESPAPPHSGSGQAPAASISATTAPSAAPTAPPAASR